MLRRRWLWLVLLLAAPFLLWGFDRLMLVRWVGRTDLEVEFAVTDAESGQSVPGAQIEVQSEGGFYDEDYKQAFTLTADSGGRASKVCRDSMCFGTQSGLNM